MSQSLSITPLSGIPNIKAGDDLGEILVSQLDEMGVRLQQGDVLAIAHKVFSKAEGCVYRLSDITPSSEALALGEKVNKDPRKVELILRESTRIIRADIRPDQEQGVLIAEHNLGFKCANAAVDESNADEADTLITLPKNPDQSAQNLRDFLQIHYGVQVGVVMTDTFGRPWRLGQVNVAIGLAGVPATVSWEGGVDAFGNALQVTCPAFADEIAAASGLVMIKDRKTPAILFRGLEWSPTHSSAADILRPSKEDLFR